MATGGIASRFPIRHHAVAAPNGRREKDRNHKTCRVKEQRLHSDGPGEGQLTAAARDALNGKTLAVADAFAGARFGSEGVPKRWLEPIVESDEPRDLGERLATESISV